MVLCALLLAAPVRADLTAVQKESKPDKRAKLALENAERAFKSAQDEYRAGRIKESLAAFQEVSDSVMLADDSLKQTGKNPSKSPKNFKDAEIRTRELLRRMDEFSQQMNFDDRPALEQVRGTVQKIHDDLLLGIMGHKKKKGKS